MRSILLLPLLLSMGCVTTRTVTITTRPPDAVIAIDGQTRGRGPITEKFTFNDKLDSHRVTASRLGYRDTTVTLQQDEDRKEVVIDLKPFTRRVTVSVGPAPAVISIDGRPHSPDPVSTITTELEFSVDAANRWSSHTISAERAGYRPVSIQVGGADRDSLYTLQLEPMRKDLNISTNPPGASVFIDDEPLGSSPVTDSQRAFEFNPDTNAFVARTIKVVKPGYDPIEVAIGWDDGKTDYVIDLAAKSKQVRITTDPAGAIVTIDGAELKRDEQGASIARLSFPPTNDKGDLRTYSASAKKKTADSEWEPGSFVIGWDGGRSEYAIKLKEIKTMPVPLLTAHLARGDDGWTISPRRVTTIAAKDVSEGTGKSPPVQLTRLQKGTSIDSVAVSPNGAQVLFVTLEGSDKTDFRSQMYIIRSDGTGGADVLTDGKSLDIMPAFSPGGEQIVFSSDRAGRKLSVWSIASSGAPGITNLTSNDSNDLWPCIDSDPKPRLFYQSMVDRRPDPRIFGTQLGTAFRTDIAQTGGMQPRINPKNDTLLFSAVNEKTGKRDLFKMSDKGGLPENLTNTPDVDEYDAVWSRDGGQIAFVSDRGVDEDKRNNADIWMMELARPDRLTQVTTNASQDDSPAWDPSGNFIYFRSNRGGEWNVWKVAVR